MKPRYRITIVPDGDYYVEDVKSFALQIWGASLFREDICNRVIEFGLPGFASCIGYRTNNW